ncbi:hypothetical protein [Azospirillum canadense]|uniref:hypothetical protein n=1 Tax=Azospirillum canadense TaxID=403962 RepID=UPI0022267482|nr:hypothetical protein [Azospirillum canadense]MCW2243149.1 hypothetical protein [Azospirillum canadense]
MPSTDGNARFVPGILPAHARASIQAILRTTLRRLLQPRIAGALAVGIGAAYAAAVVPAAVAQRGQAAVLAGWGLTALIVAIGGLLSVWARRRWRRRMGSRADGLHRLGRLQKLWFAITGVVWALLFLTLAVLLLRVAGPLHPVLAFVLLAVSIAVYVVIGIPGGPPAAVALLDWWMKPRWPRGDWAEQAAQAHVAAHRHAAALEWDMAQNGLVGPTRLGRLVAAASRGPAGRGAAWPSDLPTGIGWLLDDTRWRAAGTLRLVGVLLPFAVMVLVVGFPGAAWLIRFAPLPDEPPAATREAEPASHGAGAQNDGQRPSPTDGRASGGGPEGRTSDTGRGNGGDAGQGQNGAQNGAGPNGGDSGADGPGGGTPSSGGGAAGGGALGRGSGQGGAGGGAPGTGAGAGQGQGAAQPQETAASSGAGGSRGGGGGAPQGNAPGSASAEAAPPNAGQGAGAPPSAAAGTPDATGAPNQGRPDAPSGQGPKTNGDAQPSTSQTPGAGSGTSARDGAPQGKDQHQGAATAAPERAGRSGAGQPGSGAGQSGGQTDRGKRGEEPRTSGNGATGAASGEGGAGGGVGASERRTGVAASTSVPDPAGAASGMTIRVPGMGGQWEETEPMPPLRRFDPLVSDSAGAPGTPTVTINLPVLRGGAAAAPRADAPVPAAPALARHNEPSQPKPPQPLPAWVGHILEGAR